MLRITIVDSLTEQRLVLYGKLAGPWIGELQRVWENLRQQLGNRRSVIDLNEVTLIDDSADQLLATMLEQGAELAARGTANRWLIQALKAGQNQPAVRTLRPHAAVFSHSVDTESNEVTPGPKRGCRIDRCCLRDPENAPNSGRRCVRCTAFS